MNRYTVKIISKHLNMGRKMVPKLVLVPNSDMYVCDCGVAFSVKSLVLGCYVFCKHVFGSLFPPLPVV